MILKTQNQTSEGVLLWDDTVLDDPWSTGKSIRQINTSYDIQMTLC